MSEEEHPPPPTTVIASGSGSDVLWRSSSTSPPLFSLLEAKSFGKVWKAWKPRSLQLCSDCTLLVLKGGTVKSKIGLSRISVTKIGVDSPSLKVEMGIDVVCSSSALAHAPAPEVRWRCILPVQDLEIFLGVIKSLALEHNMQDEFRAVSVEYRRGDSFNNRGSSSSIGNAQAQSVMRRAVARAMDKFETRTKSQRVLDRRGALKFLPVLFENDLIHGSWYFTAGSIYVVIAASITLANGFDNKFLGDDSSNLSDYHYRATWVLVLLSGVFFTLGSLAFVRAVHEPPLAPFFPRVYHCQSDELIGSWFFFLGVVPLLPYCFIFLVEASTLTSKILYTGGLVMAVLLLIAAFLFARACYPSAANASGRPQQYILPVLDCCLKACLLSEKWMALHLANDWLAGCWVLLWATVALTIGCFVLLVLAIQDRHSLPIFIYGTAFSENVLFSIGAAYFVSGSYPERGNADNGEGDQADDFEDPRYHLIASQHSNIVRNLQGGMEVT